MKAQSDSFEKLVKFIRDQGYTVSTKFEPETAVLDTGGYWFARITGKSIMGGFCDPSKSWCNWYVNGRIAFDNKKCFDKWSKCPFSLEFPQTPEEFMYIEASLKYLRTKEGFEKSNGYDICVRDYPFSTHVLCLVCWGHKRVAGKRAYVKCPKCKGTGKIKRFENV